MRGKRKKFLTVAMISALILVMLYALTGCGKVQSTDTAPTQPAPAVQEQQAPTSVVPQETKTEKEPPILENATFEMGHYGWSPQDGTIVTEDNGNKCMRVGYTWGLYQFMQVKPGETYQIYCKIKQGAEPASPARLSIIFYNQDHKIMDESQSYIQSTGTEWSSFAKKTFTVPENAIFTKLFILSHGKGTVCFDNISVSKVTKAAAPAAPGPAQ